jgi:hypothetical protein
MYLWESNHINDYRTRNHSRCFYLLIFLVNLKLSDSQNRYATDYLISTLDWKFLIGRLNEFFIIKKYYE